MQEKNNSFKFVICPFYSGVTKRPVIRCEGPVNLCSSVLKFRCSDDRDKYITSVCCTEPESCPIYRGLLEVKYQEEPPLPRRRKLPSAFGKT